MVMLTSVSSSTQSTGLVSRSSSSSNATQQIEAQIKAKETELSEVEDAVEAAALKQEIAALKAKLAALEAAAKAEDTRSSQAAVTDPVQQAGFDEDEPTGTSIWI
jgi:predicted  nucleic acid-binding Zn-ribbon protein